MCTKLCHYLMAELGEEFLSTCTYQSRIWLKFIDDTFLILNHPRLSLESFIEKLNQFHPTIKFTKESSDYGLPYKKEDKLKTRVYQKPTNNKHYLLYTSCHPKQHKDGIPYGLLVRAKRICTKNNVFLLEARKHHKDPNNKKSILKKKT